MVYDGAGATNPDRLKIYLDGSNVPLNFISGTIPATLPDGGTEALQIGQHEFFNGLIDDMRIYDRPLSPAEITTLAATAPTDCNPAVTSAVAEISPTDVATNSTSNAFSYDIQATISGGDTGVNRVAITVPGSFGAPAVSGVQVDGSPVAFTDNTSGNAISVDLTTKVTASSKLTVLFNADAPTTQDLTGVDFTSTVDDSGSGIAAQVTTEGNGDGDAGDLNSWTVTTTDASSLSPLGRYCFNEAGSGTVPTTVLDDTANPVNLNITYDTGIAWFTHASGHRGLNASTDPHAGIASGVANGTKYSTNLDGATQATFSVVADWLPAADTQRIGGFFRNGSTKRAYIMVGSSGEIILRFQTQGGAQISTQWPTSWEDGVRRVFHVVFDSDDPTDTSRVRLYMNGVDQGIGTIDQGTWPTPGAGLDFNAADDLDLSFLNEPDLGKPLHGTVYYYAVYDSELTNAEIATDATALLADDDCSGATPAVTTAVAEISPNDVTTSSTGNSFSYDIQATIGGAATGVDTVAITVPGSFGAPTITGVQVDGSGVAYTNNTSGNAISIELTTKVTASSKITVLFDSDAPVTQDLTGVDFLSTVDDSSNADAAQSTTEGNGDGDGGDANSWTVTTTDGAGTAAVTSAVAEISPNDVITSSTANAFSYDIQATISGGETGVNKVAITVPGSFGVPTVTGVQVDGSPVAFTDSTSGNALSVDLTTKVTVSSKITVLFNSDAPTSQDLTGVDFLSTVDDAGTGAAAQSTTEGNGDGDGGDADSWTVTTTDGAGGSCNVDTGGTYIEAENYTALVNGTNGEFNTASSEAGYNGSGYISTSNPNGLSGQRVDYTIDFPTTGTYYVWVRGWAATTSTDSIYVGFEGSQIPPSGSWGFAEGTGWHWLTEVGGEFTVGSAGQYTLNIWGREPDTLIDGIYITQDSGAIPGGITVGIPSTGNTPFTQSILANIEDVEEYDANKAGGNLGDMDTGSSDLEFNPAYDGTGSGYFGLRYTSVNIPQGATIVSAKIQFYADEVSDNSALTATFRGEDVDNAAGFTSTAFDLTNRAQTSASVDWVIPTWVVGDAGPDQLSAELKTIVQEIVDRPGWAPNNALVLMKLGWTGTGDRTAEARDGNTHDPELQITYTVDSTVIDPSSCGGTPAVTTAVAEISPNNVTTSSTGNSFNYDIQATIGGGDTGVNRVAITVPGTFGAPTVTGVQVDGSGVAYTDNTASNAIIVDLTTKVTASSKITVLFDADAPITQDLTGVDFVSTVDDSGNGTAAQSTTEGNGDGDAGDANSWTVTTTDGGGASAVTSSVAEISPNDVVTSSTANAFSYDIQATISGGATGVNRVAITVPVSFGAPTITAVQVDGVGVAYTDNTAGNGISIDLTTKVTASSKLTVLFTADAPSTQDLVGVNFISTVDDSGTGDAAQSTTEGNGDGDAGDLNSWTVTTTGVSGFTMATGSFTGSGSSQGITGLGFQPDVVIVKRRDERSAYLRTSTMTGDASKAMVGLVAMETERIKSLDADGFTLGNSIDVNATAEEYYWIAFQAAAGSLEVGTYTGSGIGQTISGLSFQPDWLMLGSEGVRRVIQKSTSMPAVNATSLNGGLVFSHITAFTADGFTVGTNVQVDATGETYHYVAFNTVANQMAEGSYTGDGLDDRSISVGFTPQYVVLTPNDATYTDQTNSTASAPIHRPESLSGDGSLNFIGSTPPYLQPDTIQAFETLGFQVGSNAAVNADTKTFYWVAFCCGVGPAVTSAVAEISPNDVTTSSTANSFSYDIQATISGSNSGVDRVAVTVPVTFGAPTVTDVQVGGVSVAFTDNTIGNAISVDLTTKVTASSKITVLFDADAPTTQDLTGVNFLSAVDDSGTGDAAQSTTEGNGDGDPVDANSWAVTTTDALAVTSIEAEISPNDVVTSSTANAFSYDIQATMSGNDTGVNRVTVTVPATFGAPTVTAVQVNGGPVAYTNNTSGNTISIDLTTKVTVSSKITIVFDADAPTAEDLTGANFLSTVDDWATADAAQATTEGNGDGDAGDSNSWTVTTTGGGGGGGGSCLAVDGNASTGSTTTSSMTISHTTAGTDRLMIVGVSIDNNQDETVTSVTYNSIALTFVGSETQSNDAHVEIWQLSEAGGLPTGTHDVDITFSANLQHPAVAGVITFTGVDQTTPLGAFFGDNNVSSNPGFVTVTSATGDMVLGVFSGETVNAVVTNAPATEQWNLSAGGTGET